MSDPDASIPQKVAALAETLARKQLRPYVEIAGFREYLKEQILKWEAWHQSQVDAIKWHESRRDHDKEQLEDGIRLG
ncbi:MAG: hypothetical protein ACKO8U_18150, partial [Pirellula sp.]